MKTKILYYLFFIGLLGCQEEDIAEFTIENIRSNQLYNEEIIPTEFANIYGKWELYDISGGFSGAGHELDFDYLEMKPFGIYYMERGSQVLQYGSIELDTFDINSPEILQVVMLAEFPSGLPSYFSVPEKYFYLNGTDSLDLVSPCCDMYNYHFKRIR